MKKLLSLLGSITMIATPGATVIACGESSSTTTSLDQEAITKADYSIAAKNLAVGEESFATDDDALIAAFEKQLIGYINPILKKIINRNVDGLEKQYLIEGLNIDQLKTAIKEVLENGKNAIPLTGVTIRARNAATDIKGKTTLGNVNVVIGRSITEVYDGATEDINIEIQDLNPTEAEILAYFNKYAKEEVIKEVKEIRGGHLIFSMVERRNRVNIVGQGYFYDKLDGVKFDSAKAKNIQEIIKQQNLGKVEFNDTQPKEEQILAIVNKNEKNNNPDFQELTQEDVLISNITDTGASVEGVRLYKGNVNLTWEASKSDLATVITKTHLGASNGAPKLERIVEILNQKNEGVALKVSDLDEPKTEASGEVTISANKFSENFSGSVKLTYAETEELINTRALARKALDEAINPPSEEARDSLESAIDEVEELLGDIEATDTDIQEAVEALNIAIELFKERTRSDFSELSKKILEAREALDTNKKYNPEAENLLKEAITKAEQLVNDGSINQEAVAVAVGELDAAIHNFIKSNSVLKLEEMVKNAQAVIDANLEKTTDAKITLANQKKVAEELLANSQVTVEQIDQARIDLEKAIETFLQSPTKREVLKSKIGEAEKAKAENKNPNPEAEAKLDGVIEQAKSLLDSDKSTEADLEEITNSLEQAIVVFQEETKTTYLVLESAIKKAEAILKEKQQTKTQKANQFLMKAIDDARVVSATADASQAQVDGAVTNLNGKLQTFNAALSLNPSESEIKSALNQITPKNGIFHFGTFKKGLTPAKLLGEMIAKLYSEINKLDAQEIQSGWYAVNRSPSIEQCTNGTRDWDSWWNGKNSVLIFDLIVNDATQSVHIPWHWQLTIE